MDDDFFSSLPKPFIFWARKDEIEADLDFLRDYLDDMNNYFHETMRKHEDNLSKIPVEIDDHGEIISDSSYDDYRIQQLMLFQNIFLNSIFITLISYLETALID